VFLIEDILVLDLALLGRLPRSHNSRPQYIEKSFEDSHGLIDSYKDRKQLIDPITPKAWKLEEWSEKSRVDVQSR
jgi:hypothetical protein